MKNWNNFLKKMTEIVSLHIDLTVRPQFVTKSLIIYFGFY